MPPGNREFYRIDRAGNTQQNHTNLYSDYQEISPWNAKYVGEYKHVDKPFYRYILGTMSDFHHYLQKYPVALVIFGFFRSLGMFYGISNPFMGLCSLFAAYADNEYNLAFLCWSVLWSMIWCFVLRIPRELIYNGLYPSQGIVVGYAFYVSYGASPNPDMFILFLVLIPLLFFNIVFFEALCSVFVKRLNVTPMMLSGLFLGMSWHLALQKSQHFYTNALLPSFNIPLGPNDTADITTEGRDWFDITAYEWGIEVVYGVAMLQFSTSIYSAVPICIGLAASSPIMLLTTWFGSFVGISTVALLMPKWDFVNLRLGLYGINASITSSVLIGNFFLLTPSSVFFGAMAVMSAMVLTMAIQAFCVPIAIGYFALPATLICVLCYMTAGSFPSLIPVELVSLTVPEDHLRRYWLSKIVMKQFLLSSELAEYKDLSPQKLQSIEKSMLPVLMCAYARNANTESLKELLEYGADPNLSDYDGRTALHIAAAEGNQEVALLLMRWNGDVNAKDNYSNSPLSDALKGEHFEMARLIHSKGGKLFMQTTVEASALCYFVYENKLQHLKCWLDCGARPSISDYDNRTPLHIAYSRKATEAIRILEVHNANKDLIDRWGQKPMDCFGVLVIENTIAAEAISTKFPYQPLRPVGSAAKNLDSDLILTVLLALSEAETTKELKAALVPSLICALVYMREHDKLGNLVHREMNLNVRDYDNRTPLHIACSIGDMDSVKLLLWNNANPNALDRFGYSPLFEAVQHKHDNVCKVLRSNGANLCLRPDLEVSTLCWAVYNNDFDMLTRLAENGANLEARDYDERTCYDIAEDIDNENMTLHIETLVKRIKKKREKEAQLTPSSSTATPVFKKKRNKDSKRHSESKM